MGSAEFYGTLTKHSQNRSLTVSEEASAFDNARSINSELFIRQTFTLNPEKGYELLFRRYYNPLCSHAARFVYSSEVAEDIVVDVFSQFWQKQLHQSVTSSFRAYLFTCVRHAAFTYLRTELAHQLPANYPVDTEAPPTPQQLLQYNELYLTVESLIRSEPPQSQRVFFMSRFEGKKNTAIAQELGLSIKTVEGHITRVLSNLRRSLRQAGLLSFFLLVINV